MALFDLAGGGGRRADPSGLYVPPPTGEKQPDSAIPMTPHPWDPGLNAAYQQYLGRTPSPSELASHYGNPGGWEGALNLIKGSPEAYAYANRPAAPSAPGGGGGSILDQIAQWSQMPGSNPSLRTDPNYWLRRITETGGLNAGHTAYWQNLAMRPEGAPESWSPSTPGGTPTYGAGGSIFDDPATRDFMALLTSHVNALNQPYTPPGLGPLSDYLKSYFQKLQGPAYTPQQMDLLQTQALDPLTAERDAARQRLLQGASARGLTPQSGIVQKQLNDLDQQFEQMRTRTQAGFASNAVGLDRANAQQAASVGQLLANIEQANFTGNEARRGQAVDLARYVPDLARQRMLDANTILGQSTLNPTSLLGLQQGQNQFESAQTQQWLLGLGQLIPALLQLFTGRGR